MKTPRDLAGRLVADRDGRFCRVNFKLPLQEARLRAKREFKFFPAEICLTETDHWQVLRDGLVEFSVERLWDRSPDTGHP